MAPMPASKTVSVAATELTVFEQPGLVVDGEIVGIVSGKGTAQAQGLFDLFHGCIDAFDADGVDVDPGDGVFTTMAVGRVSGPQAILGHRHRDDCSAIHVAEPVPAASPEHAHDGIGFAIDAQALPHCIGACKQLLGHIRTDDNGFCLLRNLVFGEKASLVQFQIVDDGIGGSRAHHFAVSAVVAGHQKDISTVERDSLAYIGVKGTVGESRHIGHCERLPRSPGLVGYRAGYRAGLDIEKGQAFTGDPLHDID